MQRIHKPWRRITGGIEPLEPRRLLTVTYTIDEQQSSFTFDTDNSYAATDTKFEEQKPGSITDAVTGTIVANLSGNTLTFDPSTTITAASSPKAPFLPVATLPGPAVDNIGVQDSDTDGNTIRPLCAIAS